MGHRLKAVAVTQCKQLSLVVICMLSVGILLACGGRKKEFTKGDELSPAEYAGSRGVISASQPQSVTIGTAGSSTLVERCTTKTLPLPVFDIVPVIQIVNGTSGIAGWDRGPGGVSVSNDFPFIGPVKNVGETVTDGQVGFEFNFTYPSNNYQFTQASIVVDTSRDTSDTEGIFVDGVFSGVPPSMVNTLSPHLSHPVYSNEKGATGGSGENSYYNTFSLTHYKHGEINSFNLDLKDLLAPTSLSEKDVLSDGNLKVVLGDDSPAHRPKLVIRGLTISSSALSCQTSSAISFENVYLHNDGNTTGDTALLGSVSTPYSAWNAVGTHAGFEMSFDAPLPKAELEDITLDTMMLRFRAKSVSQADAAVIVNGVGISTAGFDRSKVTDVVEEWANGATAAFTTYMASVSTVSSGVDSTLDLLSMLGHSKVRELLSQGQLNVAVAGDLYMRGLNHTSERKIGTQVDGPVLVLKGSYTVRVCNVPNSPSSPLSESGFVPPEPEIYEDCVMVAEEIAGDQQTTVLNDGKGPIIGTVQILDISSTSATIVWPTDEGSTTQVLYGITGTDQATTIDHNLTTFHQVHLTGLSPYKYYNIVVKSVDKYGNVSISAEQRFRTLR